MDDDINNLVTADNSAPEESAPVIEPEPTQEPVQEEQPQPTEQAPISEPAPIPSVEEPAQSKKSFMAGLLQKFKEKMFARKQIRLKKIMDLANKKKKIKVEDVRNLLIISNSTATRYLDQLVKEGKLKVAGKSVQTEYEII